LKNKGKVLAGAAIAIALVAGVTTYAIAQNSSGKAPGKLHVENAECNMIAVGLGYTIKSYSPLTVVPGKKPLVSKSEVIKDIKEGCFLYGQSSNGNDSSTVMTTSEVQNSSTKVVVLSNCEKSLGSWIVANLPDLKPGEQTSLEKKAFPLACKFKVTSTQNTPSKKNHQIVLTSCAEEFGNCVWSQNPWYNYAVCDWGAAFCVNGTLKDYFNDPGCSSTPHTCHAGEGEVWQNILGWYGWVCSGSTCTTANPGGTPQNWSVGASISGVHPFWGPVHVGYTPPKQPTTVTGYVNFNVTLDVDGHHIGPLSYQIVMNTHPSGVTDSDVCGFGTGC